MIPIIYPYKMSSAGAKALAQALNCRRVFPNGRYIPNEDHLIINWGNNEDAGWARYAKHTQMLNATHLVSAATNKREALRKMSAADVSVPKWAVDIETARGMFQYTRRVYCRTMLRGHSGNGIVIATQPIELVQAPLYTAGIDGKRDEYRVHVFNGKVIDFQQKKRKVDADANSVVRNHDGGWVYTRGGVALPPNSEQASINAVEALGLDFGAVDVIVRRNKPEKPYILEINTACGLEGATLESYVQAIKEACDV